MLFIGPPLLPYCFFFSTGIPVMYCLLEVVSVFPERLAPRFVDKIDWIKVSVFFFLIYISLHLFRWCWLFSGIPWALIKQWDRQQLVPELNIFASQNSFPLLQSLMNTNKEDMRELAAQLYALVVSTMTGNELQMAVQNLIKISKDNHVKSWRPQHIYFYIFLYCLKLSKMFIVFIWPTESWDSARCHPGSGLHGGKVYEQEETCHFEWICTRQGAAA